MNAKMAETLCKDGELITRFQEEDYILDSQTCGCGADISAFIVPISVIKKLSENGQLLFEKMNDAGMSFFRVDKTETKVY